MTHALVSLACHAYALAALAYLAFLVRPWHALTAVGRGLVAAGLALHGAGLVQQLLAQGGMPEGLGQGLSLLAFLLLALFLGLDVRYRRPVLGAFLTPLAVAVLVPGLLLHGDGTLPTRVAGPLLPVHVTVAILGVAAVTSAAGVAVMYLLMERQVRAKHFGLLFARLPSLEFLDRLNRQLVTWGFIALSVTLVTGAFFTGPVDAGLAWSWGQKQVATLVAWGVFAGLLNARAFAGWRGRRVAFLTMAGAGLVLVSFLSSYGGGGAGGVR